MEGSCHTRSLRCVCLEVVQIIQCGGKENVWHLCRFMSDPTCFQSFPEDFIGALLLVNPRPVWCVYLKLCSKKVVAYSLGLIKQDSQLSFTERWSWNLGVMG